MEILRWLVLIIDSNASNAEVVVRKSKEAPGRVVCHLRSSSLVLHFEAELSKLK